MSEILFQYHKVNPTTWVYLSSLLMIGLYFKFGRVWSVRNLDLVLLMLIAPGLLMAQYGGEARMLAIRMTAAEREAERDLIEMGGPGANLSPPLRGVDESMAELLEDPDAASSAEVSNDSNELAYPIDATDDPTDGNNAESASSPHESENSPTASLLKRSLAIERLGYLWLFFVGILFLIRLLLDPTMVRRPLLEPNLSVGGLTFLGCSLFVFLMANVLTSQPAVEKEIDLESLADVSVGDVTDESNGSVAQRGPGYALLELIPSISTMPLVPSDQVVADKDRFNVLAAKAIVILCHLAVLLGIIAIGYWHFGYIRTGIGVATLYLMLPYTAQMTGRIDHVMPAALMVWAILCYRRPLTAGMFIGLATGLVYYPIFLLPLWVSFYWRRGMARFSTGVVVTLVVMAVFLLLNRDVSYWGNLQKMFGLWLPRNENLQGIWGLGWNSVYRIPVLAAFVALSATFALWPAQKNLGTLLSCSAAIMVATQFWHGFGGGLYVGWYLPLALMAIFRPNLEDRVALAVLGEGWKSRRITGITDGFKAA